ncbi:hypothetical protein ACNOYE_38520 [Nannocystaceae bacterium ST9]
MLGFRPLRSAVLVAGLLLFGCDLELDDMDARPDVAELSERYACADLILVAADPEGSEGLFLTIDDGLVDEVMASGEPLSARYEVGDPRIELRWVSGRNVYAGHCGLDNGEAWQIDAVEQATAGAIEIDLSPGADAVELDVELRDVLLSPYAAGQAKQGQARPLPPMRLEGLEIDQ